MKKNLLTVLLLLCAPLTSLSQVQSKKSKPQPAERRTPRAKAVDGDGEGAAEPKIGQPKRVSKQVFVELLNKGSRMVESGELDLNTPIEIEVSADRGPNGTLRNIEIKQKTIVAPQRELAREFVEAISSSGALEFLSDVRRIVFTLKLDGSSLSASASSEMMSAEKAAQYAQAGNLLLEAGAALKRGRDEEVVYKGANVSSSGKRVTVSLSLPRATAAELLSKQLHPDSGQ